MNINDDILYKIDSEIGKDKKVVELQREIERLNQEIRCLNNCIIEFHSEFCNKQAEINRLNNIINTMLEFNLFAEECPLNFGYTERCNEEKAQDVFYEDDYCEKTCKDDYKKCWLKYFERLQELKGDDKMINPKEQELLNLRYELQELLEDGEDNQLLRDKIQELENELKGSDKE